ncbi:hypothetical protein CHKEEEPN_3882 [Methylorubrum podarium]|nr:hypothetical protein CHKEEEPN_3882 [Methylorubrum podarium]
MLRRLGAEKLVLFERRGLGRRRLGLARLGPILRLHRRLAGARPLGGGIDGVRLVGASGRRAGRLGFVLDAGLGRGGLVLLDALLTLAGALGLLEALAPRADAGAVEQALVGQGVDGVLRLRGDPADLRADLDGTAGGQIVHELVEALGVEILVIVLIDLHHRRVAAGAEALDLEPGEIAVGRDLARGAEAIVERGLQLLRPAAIAGHGAADLDPEPANRLQGEHRVEGRDLQHADMRHAELIGDRLDRLLRQPAAVLLLRLPQQRDHGRGLPALRIFRDLAARPVDVLGGEREALGLLGGGG